MIELRNVSLSLGGREIIRNLTWELPDPGVYLLVGGNASGKTVLSRVLAGRLRPGGGNVIIDGEPLYRPLGTATSSLFLADASQGLLDDESLESYFETEIRNAGGTNLDLKRALSELQDDLKLDLRRGLSQLALSELLLTQVLLAYYMPLRLCVLDGHLTYLDRSYLAVAAGILERFNERQDRFVLLTAGRLAGAFPSARQTYLLSGNLPLVVYAQPAGAAIDTAANPVYGASALRIYTQGLSQGLAGITSGESYIIISQLEDGLRVQLKGSLDDCLAALRKQGLAVNRIEWETLL